MGPIQVSLRAAFIDDMLMFFSALKFVFENDDDNNDVQNNTDAADSQHLENNRLISNIKVIVYICCSLSEEVMNVPSYSFIPYVIIQGP